MKTTILLAALIGAALSTPAQSADPWRMYKCTGDHGETVYSDRYTGTDCREIWLSPRPQVGTLITDPAVESAE